MEALEFLKEANRFCSHYPICSADCPIRGKCIFDFGSHGETQKETEQKIENAFAIIEQWSKEHPIITNAQKFKEVFGYEPKFYSGTYFCPVPASQHCGEKSDCCTCGEWWDKPYKEPEK